MIDKNRFGPVDNVKSPQSALRTLPFPAVDISGGFWAEYQHINRTVSLAHGFMMLEQGGNLGNLRIAIGVDEGDFRGYWFADSDIYKWLEAVAWELGRAPDNQLKEMAEEAIRLVEETQLDDGYINSYYQIMSPDGVSPDGAAPEKRWTDLDHGHELYCAGHLIQAGIAFHRTLDDDRLLNVSLRFVEHIYELFGPDGRDETCGHPEIEMALVELYRVTGDDRHLELAKLFIDRRGRSRMSGHAGYGPVYQQDHVPLREAEEVAGHAVRQLYLTTGATDLYMESGEGALLQAMLTLWADMSGRKLYITGGVGSRFDGEAFGGPYELPSDTCYCETCAAIASLMWNWRLLLVTGDSCYADLFERTLYNSVLSSTGLNGACYLYVNPLQVRGGHYVRASADTGTGEERLRPAWHNCACCPPNVMRVLSSLSHYLATTSEGGIQLHQFATAQINAGVRDQPVKLVMESDYPWDGKVVLTVKESPTVPWTLSLRLPEWCRAYRLMLNGDDITPSTDENGYLAIERIWHDGDDLEYVMEMEAKFVVPNPRIDALRGTTAVERGPLVYCLETHDQPTDVDLMDVQVTPSGRLAARQADILGGIVSLDVSGFTLPPVWEDSLYHYVGEVPAAEPRAVQLTAVPYYLWGNRGMRSMRVWIPIFTQERP
ncbi:MAG: glycoside hydrolase family 127 protein [Candidatus Promineifilaceae bacterium]